MIQEAGGVVDFDLPPPDIAKETGVLSPRIDWYVIDDRTPIRDIFAHQSDSALAQQAKLDKRVGEVVKEARLNGIRPMPIGKLLAYLGYDMNAAIIGRTEVVDPNAMRRLTDKRRPPEGQAKAGATPTKTEAEPDTKKEAEPAMDEDQPKEKAAPTPKKKATPKKNADAEDQ
jgi:hypothetical protein